MGQITHAETWSANPGSSLDVAYDYSYDNSHRIANATDNRAHKTLSYDWSPGGQLNYLTDPDGNLTEYLYDPTGRLISLWAANYDTYGFAYDNGGRLKQVIYPNGVNQTLSWNSDNSLSQISHKNAATILEQSQYSYDGLGRRKTNQETISGQTTLSYAYSYDSLDRLSSVDNGTASQKESYGYDSLNNRVQKQIGNPVTNTLAYKFDAAQQLTETRQTNLVGTLLEAYLYDNAGNQTQKCTGGTVTHASSTACTGTSIQSYAYSSFNKLIQYNGTITGSYRYDDQGRRIQKIEAGNVYNYLYDGNSIYSEYLTSSWTSPNAAYVQAGTDHPLARLTGNIGDPSATAAYYHQDGLGSILATTNGTKAVTATQRFNAYGTKLAGGIGTIAQYGYTGREPDASGLLYFRARYNDGNGRFTQRDPLGFADGINRYAYVHGNPVNFNDPNGLLANRISNAITPTISYFTSGQFSQNYQIASDLASLSLNMGLYGSNQGVQNQFSNQICSGAGADCGLQSADAAFYGTLIPEVRVGSKFAAGLSSAGVDTTVASSVNNAVMLRTQLAFEQAGILTQGGAGLTSEAIAAAREIAISGGRLKNPAVVQELTSNGSNIADWGKFTTQSIQLPSGQSSQIHFYQNRVTGEVNLNIDFKVKGVVR